MASGGFLNAELSKETSLFGLKLWVLIGTAVGAFIVIILIVMSIWLTSRRKSSSMLENIPMPQIPKVSKEIKEVKVEKVGAVNFSTSDGVLLTIRDKSSDRESEKVLVHVGMRRSTDVDNHSQGSSVFQQEIGGNSISGEEGNSGTLTVYRASSCYAINTASPLSGLPEVSHVGWGHWFTLRDLEVATNSFARENVLGEGGYGIVYKGQLANGTTVAVKNLLNNF